MKALGLKQSEVARCMGVDSPVVHNWRRGKNFPEPERFLDLARVLKTTRAYLLGDTDDPSPDLFDRLGAEAGQDSDVAVVLQAMARIAGRLSRLERTRGRQWRADRVAEGGSGDPDPG